MNLPGVVIQCATCPEELPPHIAKQIGPMFLRRYSPSLVPPAHRGFKSGAWKGALAWALRDDGKVLGWAIRAVPDGKSKPVVMAFVVAPMRRKGLGDAMLDKCLQMGPKKQAWYYPHSGESKAFYNYRMRKYHKRGF